MARRLMAVVLAALVVSGCFAASAAFVVQEVLADRDQRQDLFEETLSEMDIHLDYVDEFFSTAVEHVPALDRFISDTASVLDQPLVAGVLAVALTGNPTGLGELVGQTLDAAVGTLPAQQVLAGVLGDRAPMVAGLIGADPGGLSSTLGLLLGQAAGDPASQGGTAAVLAGHADALAAILASDPASRDIVLAALTRP